MRCLLPSRLPNLLDSPVYNLVSNPPFNHPHDRLQYPQHNLQTTQLLYLRRYPLRILQCNRRSNHREILHRNRAHHLLVAPHHSPPCNQMPSHRPSLLRVHRGNLPLNRVSRQHSCPRLNLVGNRQRNLLRVQAFSLVLDRHHSQARSPLCSHRCNRALSQR